MSESLLSARGLKKTYVIGKRTLEVLRGVDMESRAVILWRCAARPARAKARCSISSADWTRRTPAKSVSPDKTSPRFRKAS